MTPSLAVASIGVVTGPVDDIVAFDSMTVGANAVIDLRDAPDRAKSTHRRTRWLSVLCAWYQASRHPATVLADTAIVLAVLLAAGGPRMVWFGTPTFVVSGLVFGLWKRRSTLEAQGVLWYARHLLMPMVAVSIAIRFGTAGADDRATIAACVTLTIILNALRGGLWIAIGAARRRGLGLQNTLIVGPEHRIAQVQHRMAIFPEAGLRFAAAYVSNPGEGATPESGRALVDELLGTYAVEHALWVVDNLHEENVFKDFVRFAGGRVDVSVILPLAHLAIGQTPGHLGDLGLIPMCLRPSKAAAVAKRAFDVVAASLLVVLTSPLLLATAIAIRFSDPGPAIFRQMRSGQHGRPFTIFKFRSMFAHVSSAADRFLSREEVGDFSFKVDRDPRVTRVGAVIRRFSIDELPQLFNVIKGDMSLVGPRPLAFSPDDFDIRAQIRHQALPGVTGLWQVSGANALADDDMFELDLTYVVTRSFGLDLKVILRTIPALLVRRSAY